MTENEIQYGNSPLLYFFSTFIGYTYVLCWGSSFLGQINLNYKLKNVEGCNLDFIIYNLFGFLYYSAYNTAGYLYPKETGIFAEKNDLLFGWWSFFMCSIIIYQSFFLYPRFSNKVSKTCKIVSSLYIVIVVGHYSAYKIIGLYDISSVYWNIWYIMSYLKLIITLTKYMPQVYWNYTRKSTEGWSHIAVLLDFTGGMLSSFQILVDLMNGFDEIFGGDENGLNVVKFGLSWISIFFDTIFLVQHYILYNKNAKGQEKENLVVKNKNEKSIDTITQPTNDTNRDQQTEQNMNKKTSSNELNLNDDNNNLQAINQINQIPAQDDEEQSTIFEINKQLEKNFNQNTKQKQYQAGELQNSDQEDQPYSGVFS